MKTKRKEGWNWEKRKGGTGREGRWEQGERKGRNWEKGWVRIERKEGWKLGERKVEAGRKKG